MLGSVAVEERAGLAPRDEHRAPALGRVGVRAHRGVEAALQLGLELADLRRRDVALAGARVSGRELGVRGARLRLPRRDVGQRDRVAELGVADRRDAAAHDEVAQRLALGVRRARDEHRRVRGMPAQQRAQRRDGVEQQVDARQQVADPRAGGDRGGERLRAPAGGVGDQRDVRRQQRRDRPLHGHAARRRERERRERPDALVGAREQQGAQVRVAGRERLVERRRQRQRRRVQSGGGQRAGIEGGRGQRARAHLLDERVEGRRRGRRARCGEPRGSRVEQRPRRVPGTSRAFRRRAHGVRRAAAGEVDRPRAQRVGAPVAQPRQRALRDPRDRHDVQRRVGGPRRRRRQALVALRVVRVLRALVGVLERERGMRRRQAPARPAEELLVDVDLAVVDAVRLLHGAALDPPLLAHLETARARRPRPCSRARAG